MGYSKMQTMTVKAKFMGLNPRSHAASELLVNAHPQTESMFVLPISGSSNRSYHPSTIHEHPSKAIAWCGFRLS